MVISFMLRTWVLPFTKLVSRCWLHELWHHLHCSNKPFNWCFNIYDTSHLDKITRNFFLKRVECKKVKCVLFKTGLMTNISNSTLSSTIPIRADVTPPVYLLMRIWRSSVPLDVLKSFHHPLPLKEWISFDISIDHRTQTGMYRDVRDSVVGL